MHSTDEPCGEPCDVLLVDDNPDALALLAQELGAAGLHVHAARSGEQALSHLAAHLPGAILLDVLMPGLDGFETCRHIRTSNEDVPVIFMTGLGETEHIVRGFEVGGNDYVTKPVSPPEVIARLQAHTRTARLVRATREAVNATGTAMLAVDDKGALLWCNESARRLIASLAPALAMHENQALPLPLATLDTRSAIDPASLIRLPGGALQARRATESAQPVTVFLLSPGGPSAAASAWTPPALTARESEVLLWVARGKTNRDIADILGMSPRTVNKHLEHIFEKLGVETRTAAAAAAARALGSLQ